MRKGHRKMVKNEPRCIYIHLVIYKIFDQEELQDFEVFDFQDLINVIAHTFMTVGNSLYYIKNLVYLYCTRLGLKYFLNTLTCKCVLISIQIAKDGRQQNFSNQILFANNEMYPTLQNVLDFILNKLVFYSFRF